MSNEDGYQITDPSNSTNEGTNMPDGTEILAAHERAFEKMQEQRQICLDKAELYKQALKNEDLSKEERGLLKINLAINEKRLSAIELDLETMELIIEQDRASLARNKHYDKYLIFRNIRELLKNSEIKLGQIEKDAGCQIGYMSRLEKAGNSTEPTVEFLVTAAQMLGVSIDMLINTPIRDLSPTELYAIQFIESLTQATTDDKLSWKKDPLYTLQEISADENGRVSHPLFDVYESTEFNQNGYPYSIPMPYFPSEAFGRKTAIAGDCYHLDMKGKATLFCMYVTNAEASDNERDRYAYEIWIYDRKDGASFLCSDHTGQLSLRRVVFSLTMAIEQYMTRPHIKKKHRSIIDDFMKGGMDDDTSEGNTGTDTLPSFLP